MISFPRKETPPVTIVEIGERCLHRRPRRAVTDHEKLPRLVGDARHGAAEDAVRVELVAVAHHANGEQQRRLRVEVEPGNQRRMMGIPRRAGAGEGLGVGERTQAVVTFRVGQHRHHAGGIVRVEADDCIGVANRGLARLVAERPLSGRAFGCVGRLGNEIGNVEGGRDRWADPVGRLVIEVIGEPCLGARRGRARSQPTCKALGKPSAEPGQPLLAHRIAGSVATGEDRRQFDRMIGGYERGHQVARHLPVARRGGRGRRLHRRIECDVHVVSAGALCGSPKRRARKSLP